MFEVSRAIKRRESNPNAGRPYFREPLVNPVIAVMQCKTAPPFVEKLEIKQLFPRFLPRLRPLLPGNPTMPKINQRFLGL
jgi:hypothetical protein